MTRSSDVVNLDVEVVYNCNKFSVTVGPDLRAAKWRAGLFVMYVSGSEEFTVERSDGTSSCGFLLFPSENYMLTPPDGNGPGSANNWGSFQPATGVGGQNVMTVIRGNTRAYFNYFERVALDGGARTGPPIVYNLREPLYVSENGLICNDPPAELAQVGIADPVQVGMVAAPPSSRNLNRLVVDYNL